MSKTTVAIVGVAVVLLFGFVASTVFRGGCSRPDPPCPQMPEAEDSQERAAALKLDADIKKLPIDGKLDANFTELSKKTYAMLSEKNVALLLLLRSIECLTKSADTPEKKEMVEKMIPELVGTARSLWASENGLKGTGQQLSQKEKDIIRESPPKVADALFTKLKSLGIE